MYRSVCEGVESASRGKQEKQKKQCIILASVRLLSNPCAQQLHKSMPSASRSFSASAKVYLLPPTPPPSANGPISTLPTSSSAFQTLPSPASASVRADFVPAMYRVGQTKQKRTMARKRGVASKR